MQVDFSNNYFELFGFDIGFAVDLAELNSRWQSLQRSVHPDNFAASSDAERRYSVQAASLLNEAQKTLSEPLARAGYLLKLHGVDLDVETDTRMAGEFLMQQMELREQIEGVEKSSDPYQAIDQLREALKSTETDLTLKFAQHYQDNDLVLARDRVREWQFIDKLGREISAIEAVLDDDIS